MPKRILSLVSDSKVDSLITDFLEILEIRVVMRQEDGSVDPGLLAYCTSLERQTAEQYAKLLLAFGRQTRQQSRSRDMYEALYFYLERIIIACAREKLPNDEFESLVDEMYYMLDSMFRTSAHLNVRKSRMHQALPSTKKFPPPVVQPAGPRPSAREISPLLGRALKAPPARASVSPQLHSTRTLLLKVSTSKYAPFYDDSTDDDGSDYGDARHPWAVLPPRETPPPRT
jgi:hypothetical protein